MSQGMFENSALTRPSAPIRFLKGRRENLLTLQQRAFYGGVKWTKVLLRYRQITLTLLSSYLPFRFRPLTPAKKKERLLAVLSFAQKNIPYYKKTLGGLNLEKAFISLPLLTKSTIRTHFPDALANPNKKFKSHLLARTSGTTSQSIQHIRPSNAETRTLVNSVLHYQKGLLIYPVFVLSTPHCSGLNCSLAASASDSVPFFSRSFFFRHLSDLVPLWAVKNILEQDPKVFSSIVNTLQTYEPSILVGDPVYLVAFAWFLIETKRPAPKIKFILTSYELLTPSQKHLIEEVFQCQAHSQYGGSEILGVARTCSHGFFHENEKDVWVEVLREGREALPGEMGEVVLTDLSNFNMPFIRYQIGDAVERLSGHCPCGSWLKRLGLIHGRVSDLFLTSHDRPQVMSPLLTDRLFENIRGIKFYRLIKKKSGKYEISYIPSLYFKESDLALVFERAKEWLGHKAEITFKKKAFFRPETSMKFRFSFEEPSA